MGGCDARPTYPPSPPEKPMPSINWLPFTHWSIVRSLFFSESKEPNARNMCVTHLWNASNCATDAFSVLFHGQASVIDSLAPLPCCDRCRCCCCWSHISNEFHTNSTTQRQTAESNAIQCIVRVAVTCATHVGPKCFVRFTHHTMVKCHDHRSNRHTHWAEQMKCHPNVLSESSRFG